MSLTESLTVEITADSSGLEAELARAASLVDGLSSQLGGVGFAASTATASLSRLGEAVGPLSRLSSLLGQIVGQIRAIGQTPVTIDTSPATASLAALSKQIAAVAAQLAALNAKASLPTLGVPGLPPVAGAAGGLGGGVSPRVSLPGFADGGLVTGPAGVDRVPAMLTAGEFVLTTTAVREIGRPVLESLNAGHPLVREESPIRQASPAGFGGADPNRIEPTPSQVDVSVHVAGDDSPNDRRANDRSGEPPPSPPTSPPPSPKIAVPPPSETPRPIERPQAPPQTGPVFNEITVHVTHAVDLDELLRDLQLGRTTALDRYA